MLNNPVSLLFSDLTYSQIITRWRQSPFFMSRFSSPFLFLFQCGRWHNENSLVLEKSVMKLQGTCAVRTSEGRQRPHKSVVLLRVFFSSASVRMLKFPDAPEFTVLSRSNPAGQT